MCEACPIWHYSLHRSLALHSDFQDLSATCSNYPFNLVKSYVLDGAYGLKPGGGSTRWDAGRYSESRVWHHGDLFHVFASASPYGTSLGPNPNKVRDGHALRLFCFELFFDAP